LEFKEEFRELIEDGRKTQTRRPLDINPDISWGLNKRHSHRYIDSINLICPYGVCGDILETNLGLRVEIISLGIEHLCGISYHDAMAEGVAYSGFWKPSRGYKIRNPNLEEGEPVYDDRYHQDAFRNFWDSVYGDGSFYKTLFVWVIGFKRLADNI